MSQEFEDEKLSIRSIYSDGALVDISTEPTILGLTFPSQPAISIRIEFPLDYPDVPPSILGTQSVGSDVAKGAGVHLVEFTRYVLSQVYTPGAPCIFDLIEEVDSQIQQLGFDQSSRSEEKQNAQADGQQMYITDNISQAEEQQAVESLGEEPPWMLSEIITEKKSTFIARAARVSSVDQAKQYLAHLLATDKKVAKATHNMTAWRIEGENGVKFQDCDDDGETAAGGRLLHLLELMGIWNGMVIVTRWYGGVHLGPDRFRLINQAARDALVKGGMAPDAGKEGAKNKSKK